MPDPITRLNAALEGRYRIEQQLGEGGMATVYLADDLRHERKVALKVLKPELAAVVGAERFLAEIKTTANLQHPHLLPLHDSGEADGFLYYIMPYIEGETLGDRLEREKQLPVDEAVRIATDVAEALHSAHKQGVIHRDIKPANILLSEGRPLVADFGIALAVSAAGGGRLTETGLSMGTPYYMSPEQASADQEPSAASDVYSLGCVLYEMLVGEPPYTGSSAQAVLAKILMGDAPTPTATRTSIPVNVDAAIRKSLEKLPADRFTGAQDFARALADPGFRHGEVAATGSGRGSPWRLRAYGFAATAALLGALAAWGWFRPVPTSEPGVATSAEITGLDLAMEGRRLAISPDGRFIVAGHQERGEEPALYIRPANAPEWRRLENTEGGSNPTFSPSGEWVAFDVGFDEVFRVQVDGGPRLPLAENAMDPRWALNDTIVYLSRDGGLYRVGPSGGAPTLLLARTDSGPDPCRGELLPNGRGLVFSTCGSIEESQLLVLEIETGEVRELGLLGISPHYVPTGHLVFGHSDQALMGVPFDLETLQTTGPPVTLLPEMDVYGAGARGVQFAVSENGTLIYASGGQTSSPSLRTLVWVDRQGGEEPIAAPPRPYAYPRVSPDARRVAIDTQGETGGILVWDFAAETLTRQGLGDADLTIYPTWTADGEHIAYSTGDSVVYWKRSNNTGSLEALVNVETTAQVRPYFLTADETAVVVRRQTADSPDDLVMISLANDSLVWSLDGAYSELNADLSPDGRLMAYQSDETGRFEVYVRPFPQVATDQIAISNNGGRDPLWSPAGRELFYLEDYEGGTRLMVVSFETSGSEGAFTFRGREVVMEWPYFTGRVGRNYDVSSDGQRFIAITQSRGGELSDQRIYLVTNWFSELCERMGGC